MLYRLTYYSILTGRDIKLEFSTKEKLANQLLRITNENALDSYGSIKWKVVDWEEK